MKKNADFYKVDREGLSKILGTKDKSFILYELIQNAWDQNVKNVEIKFKKISRSKYAALTVIDDDPVGFADLSHAYTLFAESEKKSDPTKRGRFNIGEKIVLAFCRNARISTTTGTVEFDNRLGRKIRRKKRNSGSEFYAELPVKNDEFKIMCHKVNHLIPPAGIDTYFNGCKLPARKPIIEFEDILPTIIADKNGILKFTKRKTSIKVYVPLEEETASVYEMGIPVVETGDKYHVDVCQKIPLTLDRTNVKPNFLGILRTIVLNHTHMFLENEEVNAPWVKEATSHPQCSDDAFESVIVNRFGEKSVINDPSDQEANKRAISEGYTVIHGGSLNKNEWQHLKRTKTFLPAGKVTPTPRPYTKYGQPEKLISPENWTETMQRFVDFSLRLGHKLLDKNIKVDIVDEPSVYWKANYGHSTLTLNQGALGACWFSGFPQNLDQVISLLIHEFAHEFESDHLSEIYYITLTNLAAKAVLLALKEPEVFSIVIHPKS